MPSPSARTGDEQDTPATVHVLVEEVPHYRVTTLSRGVVWADVLAAIAADERERRLRDAA